MTVVREIFNNFTCFSYHSATYFPINHFWHNRTIGGIQKIEQSFHVNSSSHSIWIKKQRIEVDISAAATAGRSIRKNLLVSQTKSLNWKTIKTRFVIVWYNFEELYLWNVQIIIVCHRYGEIWTEYLLWLISPSNLINLN